ncbi:MAG: KpsF/GutQ family sugar-phosphate isomerase [Ignavibacteria bacterium]|nr:KpsF/GutQ family sugar-phosphate isomerase [Ignavibacteria bacterium]
MAKQDTKKDIIKNAKKVVCIEKKEIASLERRFNDKNFSESFVSAVESIYKCKGKVVITGVGKSGIIAQKIVATFNSTGTYSIFLHSADSVHGDLGILRDEDIVIVISKSGDSSDVTQIIPLLKTLKVKIIAIIGNTSSEIAKLSDIVLDASVKEEACPHNLAPTSSSTTALVLGDALAIALLQKRDFSREDFARFHPGGILGKKLLLKVSDLLQEESKIPVVNFDANLKDIIYMISSKRLGCTCVVKKNKVVGIITDGDIRRFLEKNIEHINTTKAKDIMNSVPKLIPPNTLARTALEIMEENKITQLIVADKKRKVLGVLHMHRLIEEGL